MSTNFRLNLIEPSAREVYIFGTLVEREYWGEQERKEKRTWLKPSETRKQLTFNISSRQLFKLLVKISGHAVNIHIIHLHYPYWKCNCPMTSFVHRVGRLVDWLVRRTRFIRLGPVIIPTGALVLLRVSFSLNRFVQTWQEETPCRMP